MTSLEWINEQIKECDKMIEHLEIKIIEDKKYPSLVKSHKERIEELKPILKQLFQIKSELVAWEVVEPKISIEKGSIDYAYINIKDWHHHLTKKEVETLEKARRWKSEYSCSS